MQSPAAGMEQSQAAVQAGDRLSGEQLCWKGPGGLGRRRAEHGPAACPGSKGSKPCPGLHQQDYYTQQTKRCDYSSLLGTCQATPGLFHPVLLLSAQKRHWKICLMDDNHWWLECWKTWCRKKGWRSEFFSQEKARGESNRCLLTTKI